MKINAKLGGRNLKLAGPNASALPAQIAAKPFMIMGETIRTFHEHFPLHECAHHFTHIVFVLLPSKGYLQVSNT